MAAELTYGKHPVLPKRLTNNQRHAMQRQMAWHRDWISVGEETLREYQQALYIFERTGTGFNPREGDRRDGAAGGS